jgi:hypothetical protein
VIKTDRGYKWDKEKRFYNDGLDFENHMQDIYRELGYINIKPTKQTGDEGIDLIMETIENGEIIKCVVQCKDWKYSGNIGANNVAEFYGSALKYFISLKGYNGKKRAIFDTTSDFSSKAHIYKNEFNQNADHKGNFGLIFHNGSDIKHMEKLVNQKKEKVLREEIRKELSREIKIQIERMVREEERRKVESELREEFDDKLRVERAKIEKARAEERCKLEAKFNDNWTNAISAAEKMIEQNKANLEKEYQLYKKELVINAEKAMRDQKAIFDKIREEEKNKLKAYYEEKLERVRRSQ